MSEYASLCLWRGEGSLLVLFLYALLCVLCAIILMREIELFALLLLSFGYLVTVDVGWSAVWVDLLCVIVIFPGHTHFIFFIS